MKQDKFHNMHLTRGVCGTAQSTYNAIVCLAQPEYRPSYMRILGPFSPGFMRAEIPYAAFAAAEADAKVLTVELRAFRSHSETLQ